jgi:hypothetical protein
LIEIEAAIDHPVRLHPVLARMRDLSSERTKTGSARQFWRAQPCDQARRQPIDLSLRCRINGLGWIVQVTRMWITMIPTTLSVCAVAVAVLSMLVLGCRSWSSYDRHRRRYGEGHPA